MGLNINLFVHGVPMGQKVWGPDGDDSRYLSSFYNPNWHIPDVMKIDVMTSGSMTYCYYSLVIGQNVCDYHGRSGSYFALTIRMNAFYCDVRNLYNILKAAYDKICVGLCVQNNGSSFKYLLSDFNSIDNDLKDIENQIINYISRFSIESDIIPISGFPIGVNASARNINLHECTNQVALRYVKENGSLIVSPWFLSLQAENLVNQYKTKMQEMEILKAQEIQRQQQASKNEKECLIQKHKKEIEEISRRSKEDIAKSKNELERSRKELEQSNSKLNQTSEKLKQTEKELAEANSKLEQTSKKDQPIEEPNEDQTEIDQANQESEKIQSLEKNANKVEHNQIYDKQNTRPNRSKYKRDQRKQKYGKLEDGVNSLPTHCNEDLHSDSKCKKEIAKLKDLNKIIIGVLCIILVALIAVLLFSFIM